MDRYEASGFRDSLKRRRFDDTVVEVGELGSCVYNLAPCRLRSMIYLETGEDEDVVSAALYCSAG